MSFSMQFSVLFFWVFKMTMNFQFYFCFVQSLTCYEKLKIRERMVRSKRPAALPLFEVGKIKFQIWKFSKLTISYSTYFELEIRKAHLKNFLFTPSHQFSFKVRLRLQFFVICGIIIYQKSRNLLVSFLRAHNVKKLISKIVSFRNFSSK